MIFKKILKNLIPQRNRKTLIDFYFKILSFLVINFKFFRDYYIRLTIENFDKRMEVCFKNIDRLIKRSDHKNKIFHPIIFTIGTYRKLENGNK